MPRFFLDWLNDGHLETILQTPQTSPRWGCARVGLPRWNTALTEAMRLSWISPLKRNEKQRRGLNLAALLRSIKGDLASP